MTTGEKSKPRGKWRWVLFLTFVGGTGMILLGAAVGLTFHEIRFLYSAQTATATVSALNAGAPICTFSDAGNKPQSTAALRHLANRFSVGQTLQLRYDPDDPSHVNSLDFNPRWIEIILSLVAGGALLAAGIFLDRRRQQIFGRDKTFPPEPSSAAKKGADKIPSRLATGLVAGLFVLPLSFVGFVEITTMLAQYLELAGWGERTVGKVTAMKDQGETIAPELLFTDTAGAQHTFESQFGSNPPTSKVGQIETVWYDPAQPSLAGTPSVLYLLLMLFVFAPFSGMLLAGSANALYTALFRGYRWAPYRAPSHKPNPPAAH